MLSSGEKEDDAYTTQHEDIGPNPSSPGLDEGEIVAPSAIGGDLNNLPPGYYRSIPFVGTMVAAWLAYTACYTGFILPSNVLTIINQDIGPDPNYTMVGTIVALTQAIVFSLVGRLSDLFGRRWFFIVGNVIALIGAIIAATAKSVPALLGASVFIGLASGVQISYPTLISELVPNKYRAIALAAMATSITPVAVFGSVIIRAFILYTEAGWRWTFYLTIIFNVLSIVLFYLFYFPPSYAMLHTSVAERKSRWKLLDFGGVFLFTVGMVLLLLGISFGGSLFPWKSNIVITFIIFGFVVLIGFAFWEIYGPVDHPFIPMAFFKNRALMSVILLNSVGYTVFFALLLLYPIQLEALYGTSTMDVGWKSCINPAFVIVGQLLSGSFLKLIGKQKWQMTIWAISLTAFTASLSATTPSTPTMFYIFIVLSATSVGYIENATLTTASFTVKEGDIGIALGLLGTIRGVFAAVGQAIFVAILDTQLATNTPKYVAQDAIQAGLPSSSTNALLKGISSGNLSAVPGITAQIISAAEYGEREAYSESFKIVYLAAIAFGAVSIGSALITPNFESKFTNKIARRLHTRQKDEIAGDAEPSSAA